MRISILAGLVAVLLPVTAAADSYVPVPKASGIESAQGLEIRFVRYTGGTNGEMIVDVKNASRSKRVFVANGIYFVPDGDPEKAPQRLGAAGPFEIVKGKTKVEAEKVSLAPGKSERLHLAVFCIDSHRSSPSASNQFKIASKRMPKKLRQKISKGTKQAIRNNGGKPKRAKGDIQSTVWKSRDEEWIKLQGERKVEKSSRPQRKHRIRHQRINRQRHSD